MKLFERYNRINLLATIFIFLLACAAFYYLINFVVLNQVDEDLRIRQKEITTYSKEHYRLPEAIPVGDQIIKYNITSIPITHRSFKSLTLYDSLEKDSSLFRQLTFGLNINNIHFRVEVSKSLEDIASIIHTIFLITFLTILLILIASFIINRLVLLRLWKPFYESLHSMKSFRLKKQEPVSFPKTNIDEFDFMNETLSRATSQAKQEYLVLKEFTENASHEMQTPLAVIRSKLDLLIQDEHLTEDQSKKLQSTYNAIQKLSRLNQSLLLLTKIDNHQYEKVQVIDLKTRLEEKIEEFKELWLAHDIKLNLNLEPAYIEMNNELADVLLNNLLSNAIRHNFKGGQIQLTLNATSLLIGNSSQQNELDKHLLFSRFYKPNQGNEFNGLGLSIIKQICDASGLTIEYSFQGQNHFFNMLFGKKQTA